MEIPILLDIVVIFSLSLVAIFIFNKIKVPPIVGYLITGVLAGPTALGLMSAPEQVDVLAEIGIVLILFSIGIEFSLKKLLEVKKMILVGGLSQVILTIIIVAVIAYSFGFDLNVSVFAGFLIALSSTAIVLRLFQSEATVTSPYGRLSLSILILQDIIILPMILITPLLAGMEGVWYEAVYILVGKIAGIALFLYLSIRFIVPKLMYNIIRSGSKELFLITILLVCFSIVWLSSITGLSLALGAFLAGLIISETEYSHEAIGYIEPFRDVFAAFFFVSIGMLLDLSFLYSHLWIILGLALVAILLKVITGTTAGVLTGYPVRIALIAGFSLAQIGEFSFVLSKAGLNIGLINYEFYQYLLAISVITMALTPFIFRMAPGASQILSNILPSRNKEELLELEEESLENHILIIGYGLNGRNLAQAADYAKLKYSIIEMNPETVKKERKNNVPIIFGDATKEAVLNHAGIKTAKVAVIAISDLAAIRRITKKIREENSEIYLIVRTRFAQEVEILLELGADEVIPEEYETSVEIFTRVLHKYLVPDEDIDKVIADIRSGGYQMLRKSNQSKTYSDLKTLIPDFDIKTMRIKDGSYLIGKSIKESDFRNRYSATVIAIKQSDDIINNPPPDYVFCLHDIVVYIGD